jgi:hypothetical protein
MQIKIPRRWRSTGIVKVRSRNERTRRHGRYLLDAEREYAKAVRRRDGSSGAASSVRHIYNRDRDEALHLRSTTRRIGTTIWVTALGSTEGVAALRDVSPSRRRRA